MNWLDEDKTWREIDFEPVLFNVEYSGKVLKFGIHDTIFLVFIRFLHVQYDAKGELQENRDQCWWVGDWQGKFWYKCLGVMQQWCLDFIFMH